MKQINNLGGSYKLFDDKVGVLHTGTRFGSVHPKDPNFKRQLDKILACTGQKRILAQKLEFNTKVTPINNLNQLRSDELIPYFLRTPEFSDGVIVSITGETRLKIAVMIMNADCGVIKILAPNNELAVLHGGLNNVDNPDGSSIVENAIKYFADNGIMPGELKLQVGESVQTCCYGFDNDESGKQTNFNKVHGLINKYGRDVTKIIKNLPRRDGLGINIPLIVARQAYRAGVENIEIENLCTSCYRLNVDNTDKSEEFGTWFSNLRENPETIKKRGYGLRNAVVVFPCKHARSAA